MPSPAQPSPVRPDASGQAPPSDRPVGPPTPDLEGWPATLLATLANVAETLVEGEGGRRARLAAAALDMAADPAQVAQLRLVLRAFDSRPANLVLTGRAIRFSDLDIPAREVYLRSWATSAIPQRRTAYQGLKRLLAFLSYADPGLDGNNPRLEAIGYRHRYEPVTDDPTPIRPLDLTGLMAAGGSGAAPDGTVTLEADVAIVGSGAGGGVIAARLAAAGRSVVVLEAGPFVSETDMPRDELSAFDRVYLNHGFNVSWDASIMTMAGAGVGGGTLVNWMTCIPLPVATRREWAVVHGIDGFDTAEVDADLAALESELQVGPVTDPPPKDAFVARGCAALGIEVAETRRNAAGCGDCAGCTFGCRRGAKQSGLRVHLRDAWRTGARIIADAPASRVLVEAGQAAGVEARVRVDGVTRPLVVRAPQVVVAAGALRTPVILLQSGLDHAAMGRHLRLHPVGVVAAFLDEDVRMWDGPLQGVRSLEGCATAMARTRIGALDGDEVDDGSFVVESAPGTPGLMALVMPWEGRAAFDATMRRAPRIAPLIGIVRDRGSGRVRVARSGRPRIDYSLADEDRGTLRRALVTAARIAWAGGAREMVAVGTPPVWLRTGSSGDGRGEVALDAFLARLSAFDLGPNRGTLVSAHQMGSARAGADSAEHPCDPWGRVRAPAAHRGPDRAIRGLYVGDASLFPTAIGVNPMITTMLWARRVARTVLAEG
jgi:choline dehydrogenase-like flavoprotein